MEDPIDNESSETRSDSLSGTPPPRQPPPPPPSAKEAAGRSVIKSLRTLRGDVESQVRDQRASLVSIAAKESERRGTRGITLTEPDEGKGRRWWMIGAIVFLVLGGTAALLFLLPSSPLRDGGEAKAPSFFFTEANAIIDVGGLEEAAFLNHLATVRAETTLPLGSIRQLSASLQATTTQWLTGGAFLSRVGGHVPDALIRVADNAFMLGVHVFDGNQPLVLLTVDPYEQAFSAMLEWEPYLLSDLSPFFRAPVLQVGTRRFTDEVFENKDIRVARDEKGRAVMLYSFLDRSTLLITTNEYTLREVVSRLTRPRI